MPPAPHPASPQVGVPYASKHKATPTEDAISSASLTQWISVDVTATARVVKELRGRDDYLGARVSPLLLVARAGIEAFKRQPLTVLVDGGVDLGVATVTGRGLTVSKVEHAQSLSLRQLAAALAEVADRGRAGETLPAHAPGSLTVTNVGPFGVDGCAPVVAGDDSVLLCMGAITRKAWVVEVDGEERLAIRDVCELSLSFDQRFIDSERAANFLTDVAAALNDPSRLDLS